MIADAQSINRASPAPRVPVTEKISKVGIVGAGQMGSGIAHVIALAGFSVVVNDLSKDRFDAAVATIERNLTRQVGRGLIKDDDAKAAVRRIQFATAFQDFGDCDLVIEAATEDEAVKRKIFTELCKHIRADAIIASNTSSIPITRLAASTAPAPALPEPA